MRSRNRLKCSRYYNDTYRGISIQYTTHIKQYAVEFQSYFLGAFSKDLDRLDLILTESFFFYLLASMLSRWVICSFELSFSNTVQIMVVRTLVASQSWWNKEKGILKTYNFIMTLILQRKEFAFSYRNYHYNPKLTCYISIYKIYYKY